MNDTKIKIAEQYEKTAKMLLDKAKMLRSGIDPNQCKYGKKGKLVTGCNTCGSWVICSNNKVVADRVKSGVCATCKHKEIETI